jgi:hypothetical protein
MGGFDQASRKPSRPRFRTIGWFGVCRQQVRYLVGGLRGRRPYLVTGFIEKVSMTAVLKTQGARFNVPDARGSSLKGGSSHV